MNGLFSMDDIAIGIPLSRFTAFISRTVASAPELSAAWVTAELSDVRVSGGHCYMELIEKNDAGQTVAKLRATIWQSTFIRLRKKFFDAVGKEISSGIKVLIRGSVSHHSIYGLSFNIVDIDPSYTMGDLERLRREIFLRLQKEGVALLNKEIQLTPAPQRIAVVSAEGAAGYGDFLNHLLTNAEGFVFYPALFPCAMQGDRVSESVRKALDFIETTIDLWDCVAIVRGGGATTDLNGFDDYELAKAVAKFPLPVIVGIGHERDRNILDEIAHTSLKTPTAVAGFFIDSMRMAYDKVLNLADKVSLVSSEIMQGEQQRLATIAGALPLQAQNRIEKNLSRLYTFQKLLPSLSEKVIVKNQTKLAGTKTLILSLSTSAISKHRVRIQEYSSRVTLAIDTVLSKEKKKIEALETLTNVLNPSNTLKRGYSITRINGKAVTQGSSLNKGDKIETTLHDGTLESVIV